MDKTVIMKRSHTGQDKQESSRRQNMDSLSVCKLQSSTWQPTLQVDVDDADRMHLSVQSQPRYQDIDHRDKANITLCSQYSIEMYKLFRIQEREHAVKAMYMAQPKPFCSSRVRAQLVSKMIQADSTLQVPPEVLYLAVNILDRFLSTDPMGDLLMASAFGSPPAANIEAANASLLRLLAVGCFTMAMKFESTFHVSANRILQEFDYTMQLTKREVAAIEIDILVGVRGYVHTPTVFTFLCRYVRAGFFDKNMVQIACYIAEKCLLSSELVKHLPSMIAACCVYITRKYHTPKNKSGEMLLSADNLSSAKTTGESTTSSGSKSRSDNRRFSMGRDKVIWTSTLEHYSEYTVADLQCCLAEVEQVLRVGLQESDPSRNLQNLAIISADSSVNLGNGNGDDDDDVESEGKSTAVHMNVGFTSPEPGAWDFTRTVTRAASVAASTSSTDSPPSEPAPAVGAGTETWHSTDSIHLAPFANPSVGVHQKGHILVTAPTVNTSDYVSLRDVTGGGASISSPSDCSSLSASHCSPLYKCDILTPPADRQALTSALAAAKTQLPSPTLATLQQQAPTTKAPGLDDPRLLRALMDGVDKKYSCGKYGRVALANDLPR